MISDALIAAAALLLEPPPTGHLSASAQAQLLTYIRALEHYRQSPWLFSDLSDKLAAAAGFDAQFLQAVLSAGKAAGAQADKLSQFSSIKISSIALGINSKASSEAYSFFDDALNFLYDPPVQRSSSAAVQMTSRISICTTHQVAYSVCGCNQGAVLVF